MIGFRAIPVWILVLKFPFLRKAKIIFHNESVILMKYECWHYFENYRLFWIIPHQNYCRNCFSNQGKENLAPELKRGLLLRQGYSTQMDKSIETAALLWSKMAFFNWAWQKVKVLSRPWASRSTLALIRPLKWGT